MDNIDIRALMNELLEYGCLLQSREDLAKSIIERYSQANPGDMLKPIPKPEIKKEEADAAS